MGIRDRLAARRAGTNLAATTPTRPPVDQTDGTYGGPTTASYVDLVETRLRRLINTNKLSPEVVREMRAHPTIAANLAVQTLPLLRAKWHLACEDEAVAEQVAEWYGAVHGRIMRSFARCLWAGYSPNSLVWGVDAAGALVITSIRDLDPYTCEPAVDERGSYAGFWQNRGKADEVYLEPLETLWGVEGFEAGNLYGRSLLLAARKPWQEQTATALFHLRYLERFGEPVVVVRAPGGTVDLNEEARLDAIAWNNAHPEAPRVVPEARFGSQLQRGQALGEGIRNHSVATLPADVQVGPDGKPIGFKWSIDYLESARNGGQEFADKIASFDRDMARAMLVPSLLIEGGDTVGSNALGQSHRDVWTMNIEARLADYAEQITRHIIARLVAFNFPSAPPVTLEFEEQGDGALEKLWGIVTALVAGGSFPLDIPAVAARLGLALEERVEDDPLATSPFSSVGLPALVIAGIISAQEAHDLLGLPGEAPIPPEPTAEAGAAFALYRAGRTDLARRLLGLDGGDQGAALHASLRLPAAPPRAQLEHAHGPSCRHDDAALLAAAPADVRGLPDWKLPASYDPPAFVREPNARERRVNLAAVESSLNRLEAQAIDQLVALLEVSREKVMRQLAGILRNATTVGEVVTALSTIEVGAAGPFAAAWVALQRDVWTVGLDSVRRELGEAVAAAVPERPDRTAMAIAKASALPVAERITSQLASSVQTEMIAAFRSGVSPSGMQAAVADLYDRQIRGEAQPARLTTRMLASKALNEGRADAIERGGIRLAGAQYSALLDRRTCDLCGKLDEQVIAIGDLDFAKFTAPIHHNCRCVWVYITADEADFTPTWESPSRTLVERYGGLVFGS